MRVSIITLCIVVCAIILITPVSAVTVGTIINSGATVFIGERGLDISNSMMVDGEMRDCLGYWEPGSSFSRLPSISMCGYNKKDFPILSTMRIGPWYSYNTSINPALAFYVASPSITLKVTDRNIVVNNKVVAKDDVLEFVIESNLGQIAYKRFNVNTSGGAPIPLNPLTDGFLNINIQTPEGATYDHVNGTSGQAISTQNIFVNSNNFKWGSDWKLNAISPEKQRLYPAGIYYITAESTLNRMNIEYPVTGETISSKVPITIGSTNVVLSIDKESVIRNKPFSVTITGRPNSYYNLWVKDTNKMTDTNEQPPTITKFQSGVDVGNSLVANYTYQNSGGKNISMNTANKNCYASVSMPLDGSRTVQFDTSPTTKAQKYVIRVEEYIDGQYNYDEINVVIGGGVMSIVTQGYQNYYIGEVIKMSGTNTESYETFIFITGPNLPSNGAQMGSSNPREAVINGNRDTFHVEQVENGVWSWDFSTNSLALDAGSYTIYAVSGPYDRLHLSNVSYATTSINLKKPYITASVSQPVVASGDVLHIKGIAEGTPSNGVSIWIMGKNYMTNEIASTDAGSIFDYEIGRGTTDTMSNGQYFVVVQHPMQNGQFDIILKNDYVVNLQMNMNENISGTQIFKITGSGSLQGPDAAEALITALDSQYIDDTYTKLGFIIDQPIISINKIGDKKIGDKFTITGKTNLAIDNGVQIEIYSSSFHPTEKSASGEFSGSTGTIKVIKNDGDDGMNRIEYEVDASTFKEDEYIVTARGIEVEVTGTTLFNVIGQSLTNNNTTITPVITIQTPVPTPVPTIATPTPTPTKEAPGFGAIFATIGICIVAFIIIRRE